MISESVKTFYNSENDIWGEPQSYKGIKFYPIKVYETDIKRLFYRILCTPKKHLQAVEYIKMSYLKFIIFTGVTVFQADNKDFEKDFTNFFSDITKRPDVFIENNGVKLFLRFGDVRLTESDFDNVREMILIQNGLSLRYIEDYDPSLEEKLMQMIKMNGETTMEDQIFVFASLLKKTLPEIRDYTMFQFKHHLSRLSALQDYNMYRPLEASGQIKLDNGAKIQGYHSLPLHEGRYDGILINKDAFIKQTGFLKDSSVQQINQ